MVNSSGSSYVVFGKASGFKRDDLVDILMAIMVFAWMGWQRMIDSGSL
jgi:hypothetical protein